MKNNKGVVLLETVVSIGFISIVLINIFMIVNVVLKQNSNSYKNQREKNTINSVYSKIGNDLYKYNIKDISFDDTSKILSMKYFRLTEEYSVTLQVTDSGIVYHNEKVGEITIKNNSSIKFKEITHEIDNSILKITIHYNEDEKIELFSINFKG